MSSLTGPWSPSNSFSQLTGCFPAVLCCRTTPALTRIQRATREYVSSWVHAINAEQTLTQMPPSLCARFLAFAQVDQRPEHVPPRGGPPR
jgi:hypothetical protein